MKSEVVRRAERIMAAIEPGLATKFGAVFAFLEDNPEAAQNGRRRAFGSQEYIEYFAPGFAASRKPRPPVCPATIADPMVAAILEIFFSVNREEIEAACRHHNLAMGAENIIGHLLEHYIAEGLEPHGWIWCSGSLVKDVDFVYRDTEGKWTALQVKNRDNTENNAGKRVRVGTSILHWFRTFSRKTGDNWICFPLGFADQLNEIGFKNFVKSYLGAL